MTNKYKYNFDWLLKNMTEEYFFKYFWEKKPVHLTAGESGNFSDFFTLKDMESTLFSGNVSSNDIGIFQGQKRNSNHEEFFNQHGQIQVSKVYDAYLNHGATICLEFPEKNSQVIKKLCQSLSQKFYADVISSLFLGPPDSTGLNAHFDYYNAFILQLSGSKRWRLYDFVIENPSCEKDRIKLDKSTLGEPVLDILLEQGDILYIPRGMPHEPFCIDSHSLHMTLGVKTHNWADILHQSIDTLREVNPLFRQSLAPITDLRTSTADHERILHQVIDTLKKSVDLNKSISLIEESFYLKQPVKIEGSFNFGEGIQSLNVDSYLIQRGDFMPLIKQTNDYVEIIFEGAKLKGPLSISNALNFIANNHEFRLKDICRDLVDKSKIDLVKRLIQSGLLNVLENSSIVGS